MKKDFSKWLDKKEVVNEAEKIALFHEREVWWCILGANIGFEQDGVGESFTRPVVILKKFNLSAGLVVPLTTRIKQGKYYFNVGYISSRKNCAVLSQVRFIDQKRLTSKIITLDQDIFKGLVRALVAACFPDILK